MTTGKINDGGPAFPRTIEFRAGEFENESGMSLRDWFAGQSLLVMKIGDFNFPKDYAAKAYEMADAMLKAREVKP